MTTPQTSLPPSQAVIQATSSTPNTTPPPNNPSLASEVQTLASLVLGPFPGKPRYELELTYDPNNRQCYCNLVGSTSSPRADARTKCVGQVGEATGMEAVQRFMGGLRDKAERVVRGVEGNKYEALLAERAGEMGREFVDGEGGC